ncbi:hypothetical protein HELRODRAFT_160634 [Helobdella robusta]|uniref:Uncharacterized protein n=1 Tax=Helobdella robusta TaxID=6412 RepID=T1EQJ0_HELRO|nr:hypothetical protein HELRODRAFT_160634 [Helobdella robusta]ESO06462.1 hypothetical protein HELRODRAFT_160634 [Helobdella robusta]
MSKRLSAKEAIEQISKCVTNEGYVDSETSEISSIIESINSYEDMSTPLQADSISYEEYETESSKSSDNEDEEQSKKQDPQPGNKQKVPASYISKDGSIIWDANPSLTSRVRAANIRHNKD